MSSQSFTFIVQDGHYFIAGDDEMHGEAEFPDGESVPTLAPMDNGLTIGCFDLDAEVTLTVFVTDAAVEPTDAAAWSAPMTATFKARGPLDILSSEDADYGSIEGSVNARGWTTWSALLRAKRLREPGEEWEFGLPEAHELYLWPHA